MQHTLQKAEKILQDITLFLDAKFPQPRQRWTLMRNAAWVLKHKPRVSSMTSELRDVRMNMMLALSLQSM